MDKYLEQAKEIHTSLLEEKSNDPIPSVEVLAEMLRTEDAGTKAWETFESVEEMLKAQGVDDAV